MPLIGRKPGETSGPEALSKPEENSEPSLMRQPTEESEPVESRKPKRKSGAGDIFPRYSKKGE